jgi:hypothetical protein
MSNEYHVFKVVITSTVDARTPGMAAKIAIDNIRFDLEDREGPNMVKVRQSMGDGIPDKVFKVYPNEGYSEQRVYD